MYALECEKKYNDLGVNWNNCKDMKSCGEELRRCGMSLDDAADAMPEFICVARWRQHRAVYKIDSAVASELFEQTKETKNDYQLPIDLLKNLPYPCIAVQVPEVETVIHINQNTEERRVYSGNFFVTIMEDDVFVVNKDFNTLFFTVWDSADKAQPCFYLPLKEGATLKSTVDDLFVFCSESKKEDESTEGWDNILSTEAIYSLFAAQIVLYLQSIGSDIVNVPTPRTYKKKSGKQPKPAKIKNVGYRIGATLRQQRRVYDSSKRVNTGSQRRSPIAHIRRGHFQGFWTGPRDSKKRKLVIKWVAPIYVHGKQDDGAATIFNVK